MAHVSRSCRSLLLLVLVVDVMVGELLQQLQ